MIVDNRCSFYCSSCFLKYGIVIDQTSWRVFVDLHMLIQIVIGLFKDTTLVLIIGMFDILGLGRSSVADPIWAGLANEVYLFVAIFFFICCFGMSRYSLYLEKKLDTGL